MRRDFAFVGIQVVLFAVYIYDVNLRWFSVDTVLRQVGLIGAILGVAIILLALLQLNKNLSPFPTPKSNGILITNGLYALVRHPIYTGIILGAFSYGVFRNSIWKLAIATLLFALFHFKAKYEESLLITRFKEEYQKYMNKSGRFFPKLMLRSWKKK